MEPYAIGGAVWSRDEGYFPILNEELFGTPESEKKSQGSGLVKRNFQQEPLAYFLPQSFSRKTEPEEPFLCFFSSSESSNFQGLIFSGEPC